MLGKIGLSIRLPRTGDAANPALWFALLIVSGSALAAIFVLRRKANRK